MDDDKKYGLCICDFPANQLYNRHNNKRKVQLNLMKDESGWDIIVWELNEPVGVFKVNYCPKCGKKLGEE